MVSGFRANALQFLERRHGKREDGIEKNVGWCAASMGHGVPVNVDENVSGMCERANEGEERSAPCEEYPSRARNLFVGRPQTVRRYRIVWLRRNTPRKRTWNRYNELTETEGNAALAQVAEKSIFTALGERRKLRGFASRRGFARGLEKSGREPLLEVNLWDRARYVCKGNPRA